MPLISSSKKNTYINAHVLFCTYILQYTQTLNLNFMNTEKLTIALNEFIHVGGALVIVIAVVSVLTGFMREYIPQDKLQKKLTKHKKYGPLLGALQENHSLCITGGPDQWGIRSLPEIALVSSVLKPKAVIAFVLIVLSTAVVGGIMMQFIL